MNPAALGLLLALATPAAGVTPPALAGRGVELRADGAVVDPGILRALAATLDVAALEMAAAIPLALERPVEVVVLADYVEMGRRLGEIGEAVVAGDGTVYLVLPEGGPRPDDEDAHRFGVARALVRRAGLGRDRPWLEEGAALSLVGRWQGRPLADWPALLAATGTLPSAAELLAEAKGGDASDVLWTPAAAAVVAALPGATLTDKLARPPAEVDVARILDRLAALPSAAPPSRRAVDSRFLRGVSFAMWNGLEVGYHAPAADGELARLARLGTDAVSLMPFAYQARADRPELRFLNRRPAAETDVGLLHAARTARARGMRVLWKPHLWIGHESWPGEVAMTDEASWAAWWRAYRRYVVHHAVLAERAGAELFSIGVELGKTLERRREWEELIAAVRRVYGGAVTYSGNWWGDYDRVPFWDRLDLVGVDAYFPLAGRDADPAAVRAGAREVALRLAEAARRFGKPVLLTEVGFAARRAAWSDPHHEGGEVSLADQAVAYDALLGALGRPDWLAGVFVWKAFTADRGDAGTEADFRFLGRPAEKVVRRYFGTAR